MKHITLESLKIAGLAISLASCGQSSEFGTSSKKSASGGHPVSLNADPETAGDLPGNDSPAAPTEIEKAGPEEDTGSTPSATDDGEPTPLPEITGLPPEDVDALHKCLSAWKKHPFTSPVKNVRKIYASVAVGSSGAVINDTEQTKEPSLTIIYAGVNVLGNPSYNLLNKNGYYCMKVNVNVLTDLTINLHCNARLADDQVNVNVFSSTNDTTSAVGVHVLSDVKINTVKPAGDQCIR